MHRKRRGKPISVRFQRLDNKDICLLVGIVPLSDVEPALRGTKLSRFELDNYRRMTRNFV